MLDSNFEENTQKFFEDAVSTGCIWGLENEEGWALCSSEQYSETMVMPFWSQPEYAEQHCKEGDWSSYKVVPVSLEEFLDDWLPGMHEDVLLVGINWNEDLEGQELEPLDLLDAFEQALK